MTGTLRQRLAMAFIGALAGASLYYLAKIINQDLLAERVALALAAFVATFFSGLLVSVGPLTIRRAAIGAAALGAVIAVLLSWAAIRFDHIDEIANAPIPLVAAFVLATLPLPFLMADAGPGWRNYPALFSQSWSIFVRASLAWLFVAVVWALILLSDAFLGLLGLDLIENLLSIPIVSWIISGLMLGLALAVVTELSDYVSPFLILRLMRLMLPPVLLVLVVFILALPFRGLSGLFGGLSVAATLLAMVATCATLIAACVDQSDADAASAPMMQTACQALALISSVPAGLAAYSVWLRVAQYGWTPARLFAATAAVLALGYGLSYAVAVLRGAGWMARIRQANVGMALALIGVSALWLTPVLNPEAISARSQLAGFEAAGRDVAVLDIRALDQLGRAGQAARDELDRIAVETGNEPLAQMLAGAAPVAAIDAPGAEALRRDLAAVMPLQPATATATRDMLLSAAYPVDLAKWLDLCKAPLPDGGPGCVMVVADLWTAFPGEEAMLGLQIGPDYVTFEGLMLDQGALQIRQVWGTNGELPDYQGGVALISDLQKAPPAVSPAPLNQISVGDVGLIVSP